MKKIIALTFALMLGVCTMTPTAHALTPKLTIPSITIPDISKSINVTVSESFWDKWFEEHPIKLYFRIGG